MKQEGADRVVDAVGIVNFRGADRIASFAQVLVKADALEQTPTAQQELRNDPLLQHGARRRYGFQRANSVSNWMPLS